MSRLSVVHLIFLALVGVYLVLGHPTALVGTAVVMAWAIIGELLAAVPKLQRLGIVRESAFLAAMGSGWWLGLAIYPLVALALVASLLLLVRHRALRYLPALCAVDLVWCGVGGTPLTPAPHGATEASFALVPLAVAALAADGWLTAGIGGRRPRQADPARWWVRLVPPIAICTVIGLLVGLPLSQRALDEQAVRSPALQPPVRGTATSGIAALLRLGDSLQIERDQKIEARLAWMPGVRPALGPMIYVRGVTLPHAAVEGPFILWQGSSRGFTAAPAPLPKGAPMAWLLRRAGGSDTAFHPDGCAGIDLPRLVRDSDGNRFQGGLGQASATYRVSCENIASDSLDVALAGEVALATKLPTELHAGLDLSAVEDPAWAQMPAWDAALAITAALHRRCRYDLDGLPEPDARAGGVLRTFLLADDPQDRRGHCQYFSTAATVLLRRAGHPARTVVGYASEEIDPEGVTFRGIHAHAWIEVVAPSGRWRRLDVTPAAGYLLRTFGLDPAMAEKAPAVEQLARDSAQAEDAAPLEPILGLRIARRWLPLVASVGVVLALAGLAWLALTGWRSVGAVAVRDRQRRALLNDDQQLFELARSEGLHIGPATTLSDITADLGRRSGVDLAPWLDEHLAARYGTGRPPRPWPISRIRQGLAAGKASSRPPLVRS